MKKITLISGALMFVFCLALLFHIFSETDRFLRETIRSVSGKNVSVEVCPIFTSEMPRECSLTTAQEAALSSLLKARKQLPLGHPESQKKLLFRIRSTSDNGPHIYCFIANQYKGQEDILFLSQLELEGNCTQGKFKYEAGSLAIDNFLMNASSH